MCIYIYWLVVDLLLWKIWKSVEVGMMTFPIYGNIKICSKPPICVYIYIYAIKWWHKCTIEQYVQYYRIWHKMTQISYRYYEIKWCNIWSYDLNWYDMILIILYIIWIQVVCNEYAMGMQWVCNGNVMGYTTNNNYPWGCLKMGNAQKNAFWMGKTMINHASFERICATQLWLEQQGFVN